LSTTLPSFQAETLHTFFKESCKKEVAFVVFPDLETSAKNGRKNKLFEACLKSTRTTCLKMAVFVLWNVLVSPVETDPKLYKNWK